MKFDVDHVVGFHIRHVDDSNHVERYMVITGQRGTTPRESPLLTHQGTVVCYETLSIRVGKVPELFQCRLNGASTPISRYTAFTG